VRLSRIPIPANLRIVILQILLNFLNLSVDVLLHLSHCRLSDLHYAKVNPNANEHENRYKSYSTFCPPQPRPSDKPDSKPD
jgi:hypothetical protein